MKLIISLTILVFISFCANGQSGWEKNSKGHSVYVYRPTSGSTSSGSSSSSTYYNKGRKNRKHKVENSTEEVPYVDMSWTSEKADSNGMYTRINFGWELVTKEDKYIFKQKFDSIVIAHDGLYAALFVNRWGFIDKNGNTVIAFQFNEFPDIHPKMGIASVVKRGERYMINMKGDKVDEANQVIEKALPITIENCHRIKLSQYENVCFGLDAYEDGSRMVYTQEGFAKKPTGCTGLINANNDLVVPMEYSIIDMKVNAMYIVYRDKKFGFVSWQGKELVAPIYDVAYNRGGESFGKKGNRLFKVSPTGKVEKQ
jgi:hypothetical protein